MSDQARVSEAIGAAVEMERKGIAFYQAAAQKMSDPFAKKMFLSIAEDEKRHERIFRDMAAKAGARPADLQEMNREGPIRRVQAIFRELGRKVTEDVRPDDDRIKALDMALRMEEESYAFYSETAKTCPDEKEKEMFLLIANEENEHYRLFDDTKLYLTNPAEWNIKEEKPLIDGG